jgi:hypothetical protein
MAEVFHYWDSKRGSRIMPRRADIDPNELRRHLPGIMLVEVKRDPLDFVYRLVGTREVAARGNDPTGKRVADFWFGANAKDVVANYERVVESRSFLYDLDKFVRPGGRRIQDESLYLPLATDGEEVGQIMVYSFYGGSWAGSRPTARKLLPVISE